MHFAACRGLTSPSDGVSLVGEQSMGIVLTTDDLLPDEREAFWRHVMSDTFAPVTIREMAEGDVAGSIQGHWAGLLLVTDVQSTGQDIRRTPRLIREADNAFFQVAIVADGVGWLEQDGRQAVLQPGRLRSCTRTPGRSSGCSTASGTSGFSRCPAMPCA